MGCGLTKRSFNRVEKYRPQVLDDITGNVETIERLKIIARDGNCPHIIISVGHVSDVVDTLSEKLGFKGLTVILLLGSSRNRKNNKHTLSGTRPFG